MTVSALFDAITNELQEAGCDSPAFDACCLLEDLAQIPHGRDPRHDQVLLSEETVHAVTAAAGRRAAGEPLQYILGAWDFLSLTLEVGDGVLIPRPDTELLCEVAADKLRDVETPSILDLCAGSGCVGLGTASLLNHATVTAVELSDDALVYLRRNAARYAQYAMVIVKDDVLAPTASYAPVDALLSNPPYIPSADIPSLMREVQFEPKMALDGDTDGLVFYRAIIAHWSSCIKTGGLLAFEVGIGQAADVAALMKAAGYTAVEIHRDLGGIERVVCGIRAEK